jgi:hypothetical protein
MARYELLAGVHDEDGVDDEGNPVVTTYTEGCVIESDKPLDELFANKFRNLDDPKEKKKEGTAKARRSAKFGEPVVPQTVGIPKVGPGVRYHPGQEDRPDLPSGRKVVTPEDQGRAAGEGDEDAPGKKKGKKKAGKPESKDEDMEDVTGEFDGAKPADLVVKKGSTGYTVYDADAQEDALNKKPMTSKKQVEAFIHKYHG